MKQEVESSQMQGLMSLATVKFLGRHEILEVLVVGPDFHQMGRSVTNFIWPYLHQFFNDSHSLNGYGKPLKRPFDRYQSRLEVISIGRDIRQINW